MKKHDMLHRVLMSLLFLLILMALYAPFLFWGGKKS